MDSTSITSHSNSAPKRKFSTCFVPMCPSNTTTFPNKLFLNGPLHPELRKRWFLAARRVHDDLAPKSGYQCCEDHFDLENDVENWVKYKLVGGRLFLKKNVVPHFFECQNRMQPLKPTPSMLKRKQQEIIESIEQEYATYNATMSTDPTIECLPETEIPEDIDKVNDKWVQAGFYPHKRSKRVQVEVNKSMQTVALSPIRVQVKNCKTSPIKVDMYKLIYSESDTDSMPSLYEPEKETESSSESGLDEYGNAKQRQLLRSITMGRVTAQPKLYLGIPLHSSSIIQLLQRHIKCPLHHICLVLKKLRLDEPFSILAEDFNLHESTASRIFSSTCWKMAEVLKKLIIKSSRESVLANLPISFRNTYSKTYCIIDCLEIEIEIPSNAVHQSLTYSSYKKCNTMKYLISSTPDGVINFISEGFGGRTSDVQIFEASGFMDVLPPGVSIMADRGFKHIEGILAKKQFQLIRPPSVSSTKKSSRDDVLKSKRIASLRIHIERVIRRLREFAFLRPHACVDHFLTPNLDFALIICCALVNLQSPLIKA